MILNHQIKMDLHFYNFKRRHFNGESSPTQNFKENEFTDLYSYMITLCQEDIWYKILSKLGTNNNYYLYILPGLLR